MRAGTASLVVFWAALLAASGAGATETDTSDKWQTPFAHLFTVYAEVTSDYSFAGISQTQRQPALQAGFTYKTPPVGETMSLSPYIGAWGSNVSFAGLGQYVEIDIFAGLQLKSQDKRLTADLGYIRYNYPGVPDALSYSYGDFALIVGYDFGVVQLNGKVRFSPNSFGNSGNAWNKRAQIVVPLPFLQLNENISFSVYGTLGNQWVDRYLNYGIPGNDYWYWTLGLVTTAHGIDFTIAYTDTNIDIAGCGNTTNCQGRVIVSVGKTF